ncbi:HAMP domain-containing protein [Chenggangzhangella methanolivorans]|uniref:HAMP domain-containing protein n=1 Tax=Chenggangzhangella methanolivorans TaxID=1437009 RepID=A0A9E6UN88_9HYPH|nr:HAMP domain-containing protein [Chenggangzhangella methanolivorans]QZO00796.1 HAMP domain-containing protein [Chenggangzhangella methanolivorans]
MALAMPVTEDGETTMLLVASLDLSELASPLEGLGGDMPRGETLVLLDRDGVAIATQPKDLAGVGQNLADATFATQALANPGQAFQASDLKGRPTVYFARRVLDGQGTLVVGAPRREVVRPVDARLNARLLLIVSILLGSLALGVLGTEIMVLSPLRRLIAYAGRLQAGELAARPDVRAGGEVGALGRALAAMAAAIEDRERRLTGAEALFRGLFDHSPRRQGGDRRRPRRRVSRRDLERGRDGDLGSCGERGRRPVPARFSRARAALRSSATSSAPSSSEP